MVLVTEAQIYGFSRDCNKVRLEDNFLHIA